jgi:hypothetical protein
MTISPDWGDGWSLPPKSKMSKDIAQQPIDKLMFLAYYSLLGEEKETHNRKPATKSHNS